MMPSIIFGIVITMIAVLIGLGLGLSLLHRITLLGAILIRAICFSAIGMFFAVPHSNMPSNIMMLSPLIKFPLVYISSIFILLERMPAGGQMLAVCSPLTYFTGFRQN